MRTNYVPNSSSTPSLLNTLIHFEFIFELAYIAVFFNSNQIKLERNNVLSTLLFYVAATTTHSLYAQNIDLKTVCVI